MFGPVVAVKPVLDCPLRERMPAFGAVGLVWFQSNSLQLLLRDTVPADRLEVRSAAVRRVEEISFMGIDWRPVIQMNDR